MRHWFFALLLFAGPIAFAETEVDMHSFASDCASDPHGGDDNSLYVDGFRPSKYTVDQNDQYAVIAVSKKGGTNSLRKQCFRAEGGEAKGANAQSQLKKVRNMWLVASDGCSECNGQNRVDIASSCKSKLSSDFTIQHLKLHQEDCPPEIEAQINPTKKPAPAAKKAATRVSAAK